MIYFYVGDFDSISMKKSLKDRISHAIFQGPLLTQIVELKGVTQSIPIANHLNNR